MLCTEKYLFLIKLCNRSLPLKEKGPAGFVTTTGPDSYCENFILKKTLSPAKTSCFADTSETAVILLSITSLQPPGVVELWRST